MDRTLPCEGRNAGSIPAEGIAWSAARCCARGARVRGTLASGIERFCGGPFSRMGRKIRAEKFLDATALRNVLSRSPPRAPRGLGRNRSELFCSSRLHARCCVFLECARFCCLIYRFVKSRENRRGFFCALADHQFFHSLRSILDRLFASCIKNAATFCYALCLFCRACISHPRDST